MSFPFSLPQPRGKDWKVEGYDLVSALALGIEGMTDRAVAAAAAVYPIATCKPFANSVAPTGWLFDNLAQDRLLRVVSGSGGVDGGEWSLTAVQVKPIAIGLGQIPPHAHTASADTHVHGHAVTQSAAGDHDHGGSVTGAAGAHTHSGEFKAFTGTPHTHSFTVFTGGGSGIGSATSLNLSTFALTSAAGAHTHGVTIETQGAHFHTIGDVTADAGHTHSVTLATAGSHAHEIALNYAGGNEPHDHPFTSDGLWRPAFLDVILCSRYGLRAIQHPGVEITVKRADLRLIGYTADIRLGANIAVARADLQLAMNPVSIGFGLNMARGDLQLALNAATISGPVTGDANTLSQLRFEQLIGGDEAPTPLTWTATDFVRTTTAGQFRYGVGGANSSTGGTRTLNSSAVTAFNSPGPAAWCVEMDVKAASGGAGDSINIDIFSGSNYAVSIQAAFGGSGTKNAFWACTAGTGYGGIFNRGPVALGTADGNFHHLAVTFDGSTYRLFYEGVQKDSFTSSTKAYANSNPIISIYTSTAGAAVYCDNFRLSKTARYTADFTPADFP